MADIRNGEVAVDRIISDPAENGEAARGAASSSGRAEPPDAKGAAALAIYSWAHLARALVLLLATVVILAVVSVATYEVLTRRGDVEVAINPAGGLVVTSHRGVKFHQFLLPASAVWTKTGIVVPPGHAARIRVSGQAHLGIDEVVFAAKDNRVSTYRWMGPEGDEFIAVKPDVWARKQLLIAPGQQIGKVLGRWADPENTPGDFYSEARPSPVLAIGTGGVFKNASPREQELVLGINDTYLDPTDKTRDAYVGTPAADSIKKRYLRQWEAILRGRHWRLFFDDNVGHFLVTVEISKP